MGVINDTLNNSLVLETNSLDNKTSMTYYDEEITSDDKIKTIKIDFNVLTFSKMVRDINKKNTKEIVGFVGIFFNQKTFFTIVTTKNEQGRKIQVVFIDAFEESIGNMLEKTSNANRKATIYTCIKYLNYIDSIDSVIKLEKHRCCIQYYDCNDRLLLAIQKNNIYMLSFNSYSVDFDSRFADISISPNPGEKDDAQSIKKTANDIQFCIEDNLFNVEEIERLISKAPSRRMNELKELLEQARRKLTRIQFNQDPRERTKLIDDIAYCDSELCPKGLVREITKTLNKKDQERS